MFAAVCDLGLEGIVSKRIDAPYRSGPSKSWIKTKTRRKQR
jgi:bifunctional non-homologous end joining protein LigD